MSILTVSGWGQHEGALSHLVEHTSLLDYGGMDEEETFSAMARAAPRYAIGWSLGGQLLVRAIARGIIAPQKLVLIATPYRFVAVEEGGIGMGRQTYAQFRHNYARHPTRTLMKAHALVAHGDVHAAQVHHHQGAHHSGHDWLPWLDRLAEFSCEALDVSTLPPTLLIHGEVDAVIAPDQSHAFAARIPHVKQHFLPHCGHAPHWHDAAQTRSWINTWLS